MALSLHLFGRPYVEVGHERVRLPPKHTAILAVLAERAPRSVSREYLASLLWPASSPKSGRHSLSQAIYSMRRRLGANALVVTGSTVELGTVRCDINEFRRLIKNGAFERAAFAVAGDYCDGLVIPECSEFEQWVENVRQKIRDEATALLTDQVDANACEALSAVLSLNNEPVTEASETAATTSPGFVGRVNERRVLEDCWRSAQGGSATAALVIGEVGIGKTTLCKRVVKKAVLQGAFALTAVGYELQRNVPYGVITQLLHDAHRSGLLKAVDTYWQEVLGDLLPSIRPQSANGSTPAAKEGPDHRFAGAFCHLVANATKSNPVVVFVDDIQWADSASISILHYLAHHDADLPIFLLLASGDTGPRSFAGDGWALDSVIELKGLSVEECRLLGGDTLPTDAAPDLHLLHRLSAGNPCLLLALGSSPNSGNATLSRSVKDYFDTRLDGFGPAAISIGAALHTVGGKLSASDLSWISDLEDADLDVGLNELISEGIVEVTREDGSVILHHEMIGEVFLSRFQPVALAKLHGRVGRLLRDRGSPAAMVATHLTIAGNDPETCTYALQAAEGSTRLYAYQEAEHFYRIAIGAAVDPDVEVAGRIALARILLRQRRSSDAEAVLRGFVQQHLLHESKVALWEAQLLITQLTENSPLTFPQYAFDRASELERLLPATLATELYVAVAANAQHGLHELLGEATQAATMTLKKVSEGPERIRLDVLISAYQTVHAFSSASLDRLGNLTRTSAQWPATYVSCLSAYSFVSISRGLATGAEESLVKALKVCEEFGFLDERLRVLNNLGVCLLEQGRFAEAEEQFSVVARAGGSVAPIEIPGALNNLLITEFEKGDYEAVMELGRKHLREPFLQTRLRVGVLGVLGLASLELGRLAQAREYENAIHTDRASGEEGLSNDVSYVEIFLARMASIDGKVEQAERRLRERVETFASRDYYCAARMEVELLRSIASHSPEAALNTALKLRPALAAAHAAPLVTRLDSVITRCRNRLDS
jgi:tetratricopeptide (TPR) repeat protein